MRKMGFILLYVLSLLACRPDSAYKWEEEWGKTDPTPEKPEVKPTAKPRYVWIDAAANFDDYGNSVEKIREDCRKIAETGFTDIIVDVRPTTGDVLFKSSVAPGTAAMCGPSVRPTSTTCRPSSRKDMPQVSR